ncbi:hypothetical protein PQX77_007680 [Marasmius sp. AFHP31]|nr:hypothetical protein PQX77_007680 [Marasmius sp. AFHP31]
MPPQRSKQISSSFPARKSVQNAQRKKNTNVSTDPKPDPQLHKAWLQSLPPPWDFDPNYRHPKGTRTSCLTYAKKTYQLTDREISTLPYRQMKNPHSEKHPMKRYSGDDLWNLKARKCKALQTEMVVDRVVYPGAPFRSLPESLPSQPEAANTSLSSGNTLQTAPRIINDYYLSVPPLIPDPVKIIWRPGEIAGPVTVQDACRLYCVNALHDIESTQADIYLSDMQITPSDIRDLSSVSPWIDLATVARRAVQLHGGFYAHRGLVQGKRLLEERHLTAAGKVKSEFEWSPLAPPEGFEPEEDMNDEGDDMNAIMSRRVAVLYPIERIYDEMGQPVGWSPPWGYF